MRATSVNPIHRCLMSRLAYKSGRVLLEASPVYLDLAKVKEDLLSVGSFHLVTFICLAYEMYYFRSLVSSLFMIFMSGTSPRRKLLIFAI